MLPRGEPASGRLDADEPRAPASDEGVKGPYGVRAGADAGDDGVRVAAETLAALGLYLRSNNGLEVAYDPRVRRGPDDAPDDVVGVLDVRHPVPYRVVDRVFEGP